MIKSRWLAAALLLTGTAAAEPQTIDTPGLQAEARQLIQSLASSLSSELKQAIKQDGLVVAVEVCNLKALPLTEQVHADTDWQISRTSLKLRNLKNAPDQWEQQALMQLQAKADAGADLSTLAFTQVVVNEQGNREFRMLKAIPVAEKCLACHGSEVSTEVRQTLDQYYPDDNARGFSAGDLRGAFSLKKVL